ncbi:MAG: hypothetical protein K9L83_08655 [Deltaproteobacteria bacterium]|nr:hypothetical protein [Deltaproteobacteria bacterium]
MINKLLFTLALIWLPLVFTANAAGTRVDWEARFFESNQAYSEGDFRRAIEGYRELIRTGHGYGQIYYNLGNAYLKADELGMAIWAYERARMLIPRDADLNYNLGYARDQTRDAIPETRSLVDSAFFWLDHVTLTEIFWGFALLNGLLWSVFLIRLFKRSEWLYYMLILLIPLWGVATASFGVKWYRLDSDPRAVIVDKAVDVLAGPHPSDTLLFKLHEGALVMVERHEKRWRLIRLTDEKRGWVKAEGLQPVRQTGLESDHRLKNVIRHFNPRPGSA